MHIYIYYIQDFVSFFQVLKMPGNEIQTIPCMENKHFPSKDRWIKTTNKNLTETARATVRVAAPCHPRWKAEL